VSDVERACTKKENTHEKKYTLVTCQQPALYSDVVWRRFNACENRNTRCGAGSRVCTNAEFDRTVLAFVEVHESHLQQTRRILSRGDRAIQERSVSRRSTDGNARCRGANPHARIRAQFACKIL